MEPVMETPTYFEGRLVAPQGSRFALVVSRFNSFITERLLEGALDGLRRHGVSVQDVNVVRVPGSWELPIVCQRIAKSGKVDAIIALSAIIRGDTPHFDYVAAEASKGIAHVTMETGVPIAFGVLTTDTVEQAVDRAGTKSGNKGFDAAATAVEMVSLYRAMSDAGL
jgi:6,7-dimethyl-8-ribityllumazine synthase